ncbi:MAG TPA: threonine synthase [Blastocatellia bacterium]|nr:threonine synthase [Blastocatellia bacterium]
MSNTRSYIKGLKCRECGHPYPVAPVAICEECFGPLEVDYDYDAIKETLTRDTIAARPKTMWRYRELLPIEGEPAVGVQTGCTPLVRAERLAKALGVRELYIKNDAVSHPSLSFKDRVVAVALSKAREFNFEAVGCASTGNLANSVAANAAASGFPAYILIPDNLEKSKVIGTQVFGANLIPVRGNYDDVNRLCSEIAGRYRIAFVNVNLRPFYGEGSKTFGYEIAEQLGWRTPDAVVVPMAGGSLITKIHKGFSELARLGLVEAAETRFYGAQATGCNPIAAAVKAGTRDIRPVKPNTIAKSLAIGNPADGYFATGVIASSGGWSEDVSDAEIVAAIRLLAEAEGIFAETAGGTTLAVTQKLIAQGRIKADDRVVVAITGNGLKTQEVLALEDLKSIEPKLSAFEALVGATQIAAAGS